jgi:hypothetical protein
MERNKGHIDEGTLHAWLDGALQPDESARVETHVGSCAACSAAAAEARGLVAAASRILTALDDVPGGVAPGSAGGPGGRGAGVRSDALAERRRRLWTGWPLRVAAAVIFVAAGSLAVLQRMSSTLDRSYYGTPTARSVQAPTPPAARQDAKLEDSVASPVMIAGRVVSAKTGAPVPGARVRLSSPQVATATDTTGAYAIAVPADQATGQPAKLDVTRLGYERTVDSVTVAQEAARHDIKLKESTSQLNQVTVTGSAQKPAPSVAPAGVAAMGEDLARKALRSPTAPGCYTIDAAGLPARIELGEHLRVLPPDSAAFPTAFWTPVGRTAVRIVLGDTSGTTREIQATIDTQGLRGSITRSDSASVVKPFSATRTGSQCP